MPIGLVLWHWEERVGPEILIQYPQDVNLDHKSLLQLYSQHLFSGKPDIVSLYVGALNLVSLWTGSSFNYFLTILLHSEENGEDYREIIIDVMDYLIPYIKKHIYESIIASMYNRIIQYSSANIEQKMAMIYTNDVNRMVLNILQEEGAYFSSEMKIWLEDRLDTKLYDYDILIDRLSRLGFIKLENIKGLDGIYIFLLRHLVIFRTPPNKMNVNSNKGLEIKLQEKIDAEVQKYFRNYHPTEKDNLDIANILSDSNYFKIISLLRQMCTKQDNLLKLRLHDVSEPLEMIKELERLDIVCSIKNDSDEWVYALKSDIVIDYELPEYLLHTLYQQYLQKTKSSKLISVYLRILRNSYIENEKQKKSKSKDSTKKARRKVQIFKISKKFSPISKKEENIPEIEVQNQD